MATTFSPTMSPRIQDAQALALARIAATATLGDQLGLSGALSVAEYAGYGPDALYESLLTLLPYMGYPRTVHALVSFQQLHPTFIAARGGTPSEPWSSHAGIIWPDRVAGLSSRFMSSENAITAWALVALLLGAFLTAKGYALV